MVITYKAIVNSLPRTSTTFLHITVKIPKLTKKSKFPVPWGSNGRFKIQIHFVIPKFATTPTQRNSIPTVYRQNKYNKPSHCPISNPGICISHKGTNFQETVTIKAQHGNFFTLYGAKAQEVITTISSDKKKYKK